MSKGLVSRSGRGLLLCYFVTVAVAGAGTCQGIFHVAAGNRVHHIARGSGSAFIGADL